MWNGTEAPRALVISGGGRFADPWHPFDKTSAALAQIAEQAGAVVEVNSDADEAFARLEPFDLIVVNVGDPVEDDPQRDPALRGSLLAYLQRGGALLSMHISSASLRFVPEWGAIVGGVWVRGTTRHPEYGRNRICVRSSDPLVAGLSDFDIDDEVYSYFGLEPDVEPLLVHQYEGIEHPLFWKRTWGTSRVAYDALGHDEEAFKPADHTELLRRTVGWLLG